MTEIIRKVGSIFDSEAECLVNPTNSIGVMGAGLALAFMQKYPSVCRNFNEMSKVLVSQNGETLMQPWIYPTEDKQIMMFSTKISWKNPSKLEYIEQNMPLAIGLLNDLNIKSCAWPLLGTGYGGLSVRDVLPVMTKYMGAYKGTTEIWTIK